MARSKRRVLAAIAAVTSVIGAGLAVSTALAAPAPCTSSGPAGGAYTVLLCIAAPGDGATVSGDATVIATVSVSPPGAASVGKVEFTLDGAYLITDFEAPFTFTLPTAKFGDGAKVLRFTAAMRDGFTSLPTESSLTFANGYATPPPNTNTFTPSTGTTPAPGAPFVLSAAGDGASGRNQADAVTGLIDSFQPNLFTYLGDVYEKGTSTEFRSWYGAPGESWGKFRSFTNPIIGNHEYEGGVAPGYFDYWDNVPDYYSYNANGWHFIALNSNSQLGQTTPGTPQYDWLAADLAANTAVCTVAYFHHPLLSVGDQGGNAAYDQIWKLLADNGADLVLTGHEHNYQRWSALDRDYQPDANGITQFVVGASGQGVRPFRTTDPRVVSGYDTFPLALGALRMELNPAGAGYSYINTAGSTLDQGVIPCNGAGPDTQAPTAPASLNATLVSPGVQLTWQRSTDNVGVASYTVLRNGSPISTLGGSATSFIDTGVAPGTTYSYAVQAKDLAGNTSPSSNVVNITTAGSQPVITLPIVADTYTSATSPTTNYGTATSLRVDGSPDQRSYLRADVTGIVGPVVSATLRIYANSSQGQGYSVEQVTDNTWGETSVNWNNAPASGPVIAPSGPAVAGAYSDIPVTGTVTGNGTYSFALTPLNTTAINLASRESANPPQLVIEQDVTGNQPPVANNVTATTDQQVTVAWTPSVSDPDGDPLTCTITTPPTSGIASVATDCSSGSYTPAFGFSGTDQLTYQVGDGTFTATATATITVNPVAQPVLTVPMVADTYVASNKPTTNYGTSSNLRVDGFPERRSYLRADVIGVVGPVVSATLRIYANSSQSEGYSVEQVTDNTWSETAVTYDTAPATGPVVTGSGPITSGSYTDIPITGTVTGDGTYSFALTPLNDTSINLASRESATPPELVIVQSLSGNQPPVANNVTATTDQQVTVAWTPSVTDPDGDPLTCTITTPPTSGIASVPTNCSAGSYTPANGFSGTDQLTYQVSDGTLTATATATITVNPVNQPSITFPLSADTYVAANKASTNYGTSTALRVDAQPGRLTYLRVDVTGLVGPVVSATLRIYANSSHPIGVSVDQVADNSWAEALMTYNNAPAFGPSITTSGPLVGATYVEIPVTGTVTGNGTYSFALTPLNSSSVNVASRESSTPPQLVIVQSLP